MEAIRISCAGYPTRRTFDEFTYRYSVLMPDLMGQATPEKKMSEQLLQRYTSHGIHGFQLGKTKVFLRAGQIAILEKLRQDVLNKYYEFILLVYSPFPSSPSSTAHPCFMSSL